MWGDSELIHYHGSPFGGESEQVVRFYRGRHAMVSFARPDDIAAVADVCESFAIDNGAYSAWKRGIEPDWTRYTEWVREWMAHPGFDWAIIPDVITGTEEDNDNLIGNWLWSFREDVYHFGVPVWHFHESIDRLKRLCRKFHRVALGSSGQWPTPGTKSWWARVAEFMTEICDEGRPVAKLHGLRMLSTEIFPHLPLASADSTNAVRNADRPGMYPPPTRSQRAETLAWKVEACQSSSIWVNYEQPTLELK